MAGVCTIAPTGWPQAVLTPPPRRAKSLDRELVNWWAREDLRVLYPDVRLGPDRDEFRGHAVFGPRVKPIDAGRPVVENARYPLQFCVVVTV